MRKARDRLTYGPLSNGVARVRSSDNQLARLPVQPLVGEGVGGELVAEEVADDLVGVEDRVQWHAAVQVIACSQVLEQRWQMARMMQHTDDVDPTLVGSVEYRHPEPRQDRSPQPRQASLPRRPWRAEMGKGLEALEELHERIEKGEGLLPTRLGEEKADLLVDVGLRSRPDAESIRHDGGGGSARSPSSPAPGGPSTMRQ